MIHQRGRPILRQDPHLSDSGSGQVGKGEIYTTVDAAENDGRLWAPLGQHRQLLAAPTCEDHGYRFAHRILLHLLTAATGARVEDANRRAWCMLLQGTVSEGERDDFSGQSRGRKPGTARPSLNLLRLFKRPVPATWRRPRKSPQESRHPPPPRAVTGPRHRRPRQAHRLPAPRL